MKHMHVLGLFSTRDTLTMDLIVAGLEKFARFIETIAEYIIVIEDEIAIVSPISPSRKRVFQTLPGV